MVGEVERRARFGYALQRAMKFRGVSDRQLAKALGIDARKIAAFRTGKSLPDLFLTQEMAVALRVTEELFRNPPEVPPEPAYPLEDYLLEQAAADAALGGQPGDDPPVPRSSPRKSRTPGR